MAGDAHEWDNVVLKARNDFGQTFDEVAAAVDNPASTRQVGGDHYRRYRFQPWQIVEEYGLDFFEGNALKYLLRRKGDRLQDLEKLQHYVGKLIEREKLNHD
jgi:hypothetical protein